MVKNQLVWTRRSQQHLKALYKYISATSPQNAQKVVMDIIIATEKSIANPTYYNPDNLRSITMAATVLLKNITTGLLIVIKKI